MIALGIDPGSAICGFGVVVGEGTRVRLVDAGVIRTTVGLSDGERLVELERTLDALLAEHRPDRVAVERLYFQRNTRTAMAVAQARGVVLLVLARRGLIVEEPTPSEIKLAICGNGTANKAQVAAMVSRLLGQELGGVIDDATDALAAAIGALRGSLTEAPRAVAL